MARDVPHRTSSLRPPPRRLPLVHRDRQHPWVRPGHLFTKGPGTYKIPSANDIPIDFRVTLLHNAPNVRAIHSSKVGSWGRARDLFCDHWAMWVAGTQQLREDEWR